MNVKKYIFLTLLFSVGGISLIAQSVIPKNGTIMHDDKARPCIQVNVDPEPKTLKKAWKNYLEDNYDFKLKGIGFFTNKDLLSAEDIQLPSVSSNSMDFYTHIVEDENGSEMKVFAAFGYDIYINEETLPTEYSALSDIIIDFLKSYLPRYHQELINDTEERIKELSEERKDLKEEIAEDEEEFEELQQEFEAIKIEFNELNDKLETNRSKLEIAKRKLENRKEKLERLRYQINVNKR